LTIRGKVLREYSISTAKAGVGEISGSYQTPRGQHLIRAKSAPGRQTMQSLYAVAQPEKSGRLRWMKHFPAVTGF
jgi:hypothetical protein